MAALLYADTEGAKKDPRPDKNGIPDSFRKAVNRIFCKRKRSESLCGKAAKKYGVFVLRGSRNPRGTSDGMVDVMVKQEDAVRINRIVERFRFAQVTGNRHRASGN